MNNFKLVDMHIIAFGLLIVAAFALATVVPVSAQAQTPLAQGQSGNVQDGSSSSSTGGEMMPMAPAPEGWYLPNNTDPQPVALKTRTDKFYFGLGSEFMFFSSDLGNANVSGPGSNFLLRFGRKVGLSIGVINPGSHFYWSFDIGRNGAKKVAHTDVVDFWILTPTVAMEMVVMDSESISFGAGFTATGMRMTFCEPFPIYVDLRGPNVHIFNDLGISTGTFTLPIGFSIDAGIPL